VDILNNMDKANNKVIANKDMDNKVKGMVNKDMDSKVTANKDMD
jgi:hypothetical protein